MINPELETQVGQRATLTGTAQNAAAGASLLVDGWPVYIGGLSRWPADLAGRKLDVTGTLVSTRGPAPEKRVHGRPGGGYALNDASWAPHES
jgi:hypothetical protein